MKWVAWQMWGRKRPPKALAGLRRDSAYRLTSMQGQWPPFPDLLMFWITACSHEQLDMIIQYRTTYSLIPSIMVVSVKSAFRAALIRSGFDDVISCYAETAELSARIDILIAKNTLMRGMVRLGDLRFSLFERRVWRDKTEIQLMPREFDLLLTLAQAQGRLRSRKSLLRETWKQDFEPGTNSVEVHIFRLREKLNRVFPSALVETVRGKGYRLRTEKLGVVLPLAIGRCVDLPTLPRANVANSPMIVNGADGGPPVLGSCQCNRSECHGTCRIFL